MRRIDPGAAVVCDIHLVAVAQQHRLDEGCDIGIVFDDQYTCHAGSSGHRCVPTVHVHGRENDSVVL